MTIVSLIIVLGVLIFVHELGHFAAAKAVGIDVQRFSIGLGPKVVGFRRGETEYVLSAIPLGGYVKMGGMEDEVMERLEGGGDGPREPRPGDFDGKPLWARAFVISAGVAMNMLFALVVYAGTVAVWGFQVRETTRIGRVEVERLPAGAEALARIPYGARVARLGDHEVEHWTDLVTRLRDASPGPLAVETEEPAGRWEIRVPESEEARRAMATSVRAWAEAEVGAVDPGSPADRAGLQPGDRIVAVDGEPVDGWFRFVDRVESSPGSPLQLRVARGSEELDVRVTPATEQVLDPATGRTRTVGKVGIYEPLGDLLSERASLVEAVAFGWRSTVDVTVQILAFLRDIFTGGVSPRSVGSIITIGEVSGQAARMGVVPFLNFMALLSVNLAVLNLLPIPVLDGGHLVFLGIEAVRGRALSLEQRLKWSNVGFLIVMGIMIWALSNDFLRLFGL